MAKKFLTSLHGGMNRHDEPEMLPENVVQQAIGIDFRDAGKLKPLMGGKNLNVTATHMESGWVNGEYVLYYTCGTGLYRYKNTTSTLLSASITSTFDVEVLNDVAYITSSTARLREDDQM